ncbi:hypothetical protein ACKGJO_05295 [Gracilimonas sp. Q87]|uniref:SH3 domain-containing protein n=1 Tax=Gracilimonas sp. Q87 TaxID=3384766 RepID=UPI003984497C
MRYLITFLLFLSLPLIVQSQSIDSLNAEIEALELREQSIQQQIDSLNEKIKDVRWELVKKRNELEDIQDQEEKEQMLEEGFTATVSSSLYSMKEEPTVSAKKIADLSVGDEVIVYDFFQRPYLKISYKGQEGYITHGALEQTDLLDEITGETERLREEDPRLPELIDKFGRATARKIIREEVWIGMTDEMARASWGRPRDINRSTNAYGVNEQWVYPYGKYLYFEDGVLTTIQE